MEIKTKKVDDKIIVFLNGRIDIVKADLIEEEINKLITNGEKQIIFDLKDVSYFSSSGMRMIISIRRKLSVINGSMALVNLHQMAEKILKTLDLFDKYKIYNDLETALKN